MSRLMLCWVLSWFIPGTATPVQADDSEDKAVEFVEKVGGKITRDESLPGRPVTGVNLNNTRVTDADVKILANLKQLTHLDLGVTKVTDAGVKELSPLTKLTSLNLFFTGVTDVGVKGLAPLTNITSLNLSTNTITDAGLKELARRKNLTELHVTGDWLRKGAGEEVRPKVPHLYPQKQGTGGGKEKEPLDVSRCGSKYTQ